MQKNLEVDEKPLCAKHPQVTAKTSPKDVPEDCPTCQEGLRRRQERATSWVRGAKPAEPLPETPARKAAVSDHRQLQIDRLRADIRDFSEQFVDLQRQVERHLPQLRERLRNLELEGGKDPDDLDDLELATDPEPDLVQRVATVERRMATLDEQLRTIEPSVKNVEARVLPRGAVKVNEELNLFTRCRELEERIKAVEKRLPAAKPTK